jgi:uncharacterized protein
MANDGRAYRNTLLTLWVILSVIAFYWYSTHQNIPARIAICFTVAVLVETAFYLAPGFAWPRGLIESIEPPLMRAFVLTCTAVIPFLVYALGTGTFHWRTFGLLAILASVEAAWFAVQTSKRPLVDILFVLFFGAVLLSKVFAHIYITLAPRVTAEILGNLMWIRLGILSALTVRKIGGTGFGFIPTARDWRTGAAVFIAFAPIAIAIGMSIQFGQPHAAKGSWWTAIAVAAGTFAGILWVVALWEEFFFRGILQQVLAKRTSKIAALLVASVVFGLGHLTFAHRFPNWKMALMAGIAGVFYGIAYLRAGSVRASMVTHALVVTTWKVFFD